LWQEEPPLRRWRLESYLLTTEPLDLVSERCALPLETVMTYHDLFFDCRSRLHATDWIMLRAVGTYPWRGFAEQSLGAIWKYCGYTGGGNALELAISVTTDQPLPDWFRATCCDQSEYQEGRMRLLGKLVIGAMTAKFPAEIEALKQAHDRIQRLDTQVMGKRD